MTENNMLVVIGKIKVKLPLLIMISPGNLKTEILGKIKNTVPVITKMIPRTTRNLAMLCINTCVTFCLLTHPKLVLVVLVSLRSS